MPTEDGDRRLDLLIPAFIFGAISLISVILRIYTRAKLVRWIGADDFLIVFAELGAIAQVVGAFGSKSLLAT